MYREKRHWITESLHDMGHQVVERADGPITELTEETLLIVDSANYFPQISGNLVRIPKQDRPFTAIWHTEPLPPPEASGIKPQMPHLRELAKIMLRDRRATDIRTNARAIFSLHASGIPDLLMVSTQGRVDFLQEHHIHANLVPIGYSSAAHGRYEPLEKDIDVLFLGDLRVPRRRRLLKKLQRSGLQVLIKGSWLDPNCWGESRNKLLNKTKILINIQRYVGELSGNRLLLGMAAKALVISEPMYKPIPYKEGKHFISVPFEKMAESIRFYLENEEKRAEIAEAGYRLATNEITHQVTINRIVELIRGGMDARK